MCLSLLCAVKVALQNSTFFSSFIEALSNCLAYGEVSVRIDPKQGERQQGPLYEGSEFPREYKREPALQ